MNLTGRMLTAVLLCWALGGVALAQDGKTLEAFLSDRSPALLFQVNQLSLGSWNGGLGMMLSSRPDMHWRVALHPRFGDVATEYTDSSGTADDDENGQYGLGVSIAPFWVLSKTDAFFITAGITVFYRYTSSSNVERNEWTPSYRERNVSEHDSYLGGDFGVGWAISSRIALHGEYHFNLGANLSSTEEQSGVEGGTLNSTKWSRSSVSIGYGASLSLLVRL